MSEARIPRLAVEEAKVAAAGVGVPDYMADLSIFQVLLHHPPLAARFNELLSEMLFRGSLDTRLRELVIMRLGWVTGSVYEWTQHWRVALLLEVATEEDLVAVRDWEAYGGFGPAERAVLAATDEVVRDGAISARTWQECADHLGDTKSLLELVLVIGTWRMVSSVLRSLEVPLEEGVAAWPPDGRGPGA